MGQIVAGIVVAAGRGMRAGGSQPKQYRDIQGVPVIRVALAAFADHSGVHLVQPVINLDDLAHYRTAIGGLAVLEPVAGKATRQGSVAAGLEAVRPYHPDKVLVHDAARPFVSAALIDRALAAKGAAVPALPLVDTVKLVTDGRVLETLDRTRLRSVQTPQVFDFEELLSAHKKAAAAGRHDFTDDASLAEWAGIGVGVFDGDPTNVKLTTAEDFMRAEAAQVAALTDVRIGSGYDVHAFAIGDHVMLGGVRVPHDRGLTGHSDADVALHALVDAVLGALAEGDIGTHFPPSDERWRGASSDKFLAFAVERVRARGGQLAHLDVTLVCEAPRIGPHRDAMRQRIAEIAAVSIDRVAVKATTSEKLGFTGRREGIAAHATATVRLPWKTG
ncbi:MAG: bifunctional 2-C-methyl-D-erythritol 4-phosphate cytidylyltransferase/2-C-methyl-D-erythritol 2,4-cyclodiphosphate synthase [Xanthobacteraceae bacterium]